MKDFAHKYHALLTSEYKGINLTRITDFDEFYEKQILDSIAPLEQSSEFQMALKSCDLFVDIGFGGGFPLLPLAHRNQDKKHIGFEARAKKAKVVNELAEKLGMKNVRCYHRRFESVNFDTNAVVTFKAVGKISDLLKMFYVSAGVKVFFYKGANLYDLEDVPHEVDGWQLIAEDKIEVPNTEARYLIGYEKNNVPRGTKSNKELVNLSALV